MDSSMFKPGQILYLQKSEQDIDGLPSSATDHPAVILSTTQSPPTHFSSNRSIQVAIITSFGATPLAAKFPNPKAQRDKDARANHLPIHRAPGPRPSHPDNLPVLDCEIKGNPSGLRADRVSYVGCRQAYWVSPEQLGELSKDGQGDIARLSHASLCNVLDIVNGHTRRSWGSNPLILTPEVYKVDIETSTSEPVRHKRAASEEPESTPGRSKRVDTTRTPSPARSISSNWRSEPVTPPATPPATPPTTPTKPSPFGLPTPQSGSLPTKTLRYRAKQPAPAPKTSFAAFSMNAFAILADRDEDSTPATSCGVEVKVPAWRAKSLVAMA